MFHMHAVINVLSKQLTHFARSADLVKVNSNKNRTSVACISGSAIPHAHGGDSLIVVIGWPDIFWEGLSQTNSIHR